jgi:hypothetical protein
MRTKRKCFSLIAGFSIGLLAATMAYGRTPAPSIDPAPCDPVCIDPIDIPVKVYTTGWGDNLIGIDRLASPIWIDGEHAQWYPERAVNYSLLAKGGDLYSLGTDTGASIGGSVLRRNGEFVREYPLIPSSGYTAKELWSSGNDIYVLDSIYESWFKSGRIYKNETLLYQFDDGFVPISIHGATQVNGTANIVLGGVRWFSYFDRRATVFKNGQYITLSNAISDVAGIYRTSNGWIHVVGRIWESGTGVGYKSTYWKISPSNVVTTQNLMALLPGTTNGYATDIHVANNGMVYISGAVSFSDGNGQWGSQNAIVWVNGIPSVLPAGDLLADEDMATAVAVDINGNYYVAGNWKEDINQQASVGVVWKNGQLSQIMQSSAEWSVLSDIVVK